MLLEFETLAPAGGRRLRIWLDPADISVIEDLEKAGPSGYRGLRLTMKDGKNFNICNPEGQTIKAILAARADRRPATKEEPNDPLHELFDPL